MKYVVKIKLKHPNYEKVIHRKDFNDKEKADIYYNTLNKSKHKGTYVILEEISNKNLN